MSATFLWALVRTTDFPATRGARVVGQIARLLRSDGRRVVVADAEWRRMLAFEAFREVNASRSDFGTWQKASRPLGELDSLQKILRLADLAPIHRMSKVATPLVPTTPGPLFLVDSSSANRDLLAYGDRPRS